MKTLLANPTGRRRALLLTLCVALAASTASWAFWGAQGSGAASGHVGTLQAPTITSALGGAESATVSWSSVTAPSSGAVEYYVSRDGSPAAGSCPTASAPSTATSCTDSGVSPGSHSYTVTAIWHSWTATSAAKAVSVISKPTVVSASPSARVQGASNQTIAITGSHFLSGAAATFSGSGITVNSTTFKSSTELTANVSISGGAATGARNVTVTNTDSGTGTGTGIFNVDAPPNAESVSPGSRGQGANEQNLTIKGKNFASGATTTFSGSGVTVNSTTFKSATELTANVTISSSATVGLRSVTVTNADGGSDTQTNAFSVTAAPTVTSTSPSSRGQGASSQTVTIKGSGFVSGAAASFSGNGITVNSTTFKSATELRASVSIESSASVGLRTVTVTNPDAGTGSLANGFAVNAGPTVGSVSPSARAKGTGTQNVTIKGSGFVSGAEASFSGSGITVNSTSFKSSTELTASITISSSATTGSRNVTVTNTDGGSDSLEGGFTVNNAPSIESVSPSSRGQAASNQTIAIKGKNLLNGTGLAVSFSGTGITVNSTSYVSAGEVTANVTIASNATTGPRNVTVTNPDTTSATSTGAFSVNAAATVTSTSPSSRGQGASKQAIAIKGTGFVTGAGASFGPGITVESTTRNSATELTATISIESGASTGLRTVTVTNGDGGVASLANGFTVSAAPGIESTNPSSRSQGAAKQTIVIKGSGFVSGAAASFGSGITVESTSFVNSSELSVKATVEQGTSIGARTVTVTNPDGGTGSLANDFTVTAGPNITSPTSSISNRVKIAHNNTGEFKILGSGFVSGATVSISGGFTVNLVTFVNAGELKVKVTAGNGSQTGKYNLTVTNPDGGSDTSEGAIENT